MDQLDFVAVVWLLAMLTGFLLLELWGFIQQRLNDRKMHQLEKFIASKGKKMAVEIICECMDALPEKISEVKRTIEEG